MSGFIYVFSEAGRDALLSKEYEMIKEDCAKNIYVFLNKDSQNFTCDNVPYVLSDTLTF